jgi:hypothetical protein
VLSTGVPQSACPDETHPMSNAITCRCRSHLLGGRAQDDLVDVLVRPTWCVRSAGIDHPGDVISAAPGDGKRELSLSKKNCYAPGKCAGRRHAVTTIAGPPCHDLRRRRSSHVRQHALFGMAFASGPDRAITGKGLDSPLRHRHTLSPAWLRPVRREPAAPRARRSNRDRATVRHRGRNRNHATGDVMIRPHPT